MASSPPEVGFEVKVNWREIANELTEQNLRSGRLTGKPEVTAKICRFADLGTQYPVGLISVF
jgi:hypothetical protein